MVAGDLQWATYAGTPAELFAAFFADNSEISDPRLLQYHDWNGERETLTNQGVRDMLKNCGIRLIGYRHLEIQGAELTVRNEAE